MKIILLKLLIALLLLENSLFALADDKPSYIGEYAEKNIIGTNTKVDFPKCRQIDSNLLVSQSGVWYILSECDIEQSKIKSIRIWRAKLDGDIGLKITGEIILPWKPIKWNDYALASCKEKDQELFKAGVYIRMGNRGALDANDKNALAFFAERDNGAIEKIPFSKIDECDYAQGE